MPKYTELKNNFTNGEISPRAYGRFDFVKYPNSAKKIENFLINQLGGLSYTPGTRYVATTKDSSARSRLIPFQFNSAQAYLLEFGNKYTRFYTQHAQVVVGASNPIDSYTVLLSHFDGPQDQAAYTAEVGGDFSFFANSVLDMAQFEFGTSSLKLTGGSDKVTLPDSANWDFGTGDYTIEFWMRESVDGDYDVIDVGHGSPSGSAKGVGIRLGSGNASVSINGVNNVLLATPTFTAGTWYHIALVRNGGGANNTVLYINGTSAVAATNTDDITGSTEGVTIGAWNNAFGNPFQGWIDEVRISKGIARYTGNFTPPVAAFGGAAAWVTSHSYAVGDYVTQSGTVYLCLVAHTSGTFSTDLAAGDWTAQAVLEVVTPYSLADLQTIHYSQNADVMYLYHKSYETRKLTRTSATAFTLAKAGFVRGPFRPTNITAATLTASAATGTAINVTASVANTIVAGHVGALFRIKSAVVKIVSITSTTVAVADVQAEPNGTAGNIGSTSAETDWAEGKYSDFRGWPATGTFHQQRHYVGGATSNPQDEDGSVIGEYDNFKTDANDDAAAVDLTIVADQINSIKWLNSDVDSLQGGTSGGIFTTESGSQGLSITAANVNAHKDSGYGVASIMPKRISSFLYYIHKSLYKLFEHVFNYLSSRHVSSDMTLLADHILRDGQGAYDMAYQQSPNDRIWIVRNDGQLAIMNRNPEQEVVGWARRIAGNDSTTSGMFESIACISQDSQDDEVWVIVKRQIGGVTKRFIEYFTPEYYSYKWEPILLDASLSLNTPYTISAATKANPVVITAVNHPFSNGDFVKIDKVVGMTNLNGNSYKVANKTTNTFEIQDSSGANIDGTGFSTYISDGEVRKMVTNISGATHLNGETVGVQADGIDVGNFTISAGALSPALTTRAAVVHVGLRYTPKIQLLKFSGQTAQGTAQTKPRRIYQVVARVSQSQGFSIGQDENNLSAILTPNGATGDIYDGDIDVGKGGFVTWFATDTEMFIEKPKAEPLNLLALIIRNEVQEGPQ